MTAGTWGNPVRVAYRYQMKKRLGEGGMAAVYLLVRIPAREVSYR